MFLGRMEGLRAPSPLHFLSGFGSVTCGTVKRNTFDISRRSHYVKFFSITSIFICYKIYLKKLQTANFLKKIWHAKENVFQCYVYVLAKFK